MSEILFPPSEEENRTKFMMKCFSFVGRSRCPIYVPHNQTSSHILYPISYLPITLIYDFPSIKCFLFQLLLISIKSSKTHWPEINYTKMNYYTLNPLVSVDVMCFKYLESMLFYKKITVLLDFSTGRICGYMVDHASRLKSLILFRISKHYRR